MKQYFKILVLVLCVPLLAASQCEEYQVNEDFEDFISDVFECQQNDVQDCYCENGELGIQFCDVENSAWQACVCNADCEQRSEICDGVDNNCDGIVDVGAVDSLTWYRDMDNDNYGDSSNIRYACDNPGTAEEPYVLSSTDCNDTLASVNPLADEVCDGVDNDCDNYVDEGDSICPTGQVCSDIYSNGNWECTPL